MNLSNLSVKIAKFRDRVQGENYVKLDTGILHLMNNYDTVHIKNLTLDSNNTALSIFGDGVFPCKLVLENCDIGNNAKVFDTEYSLDFVSWSARVHVESIVISGKLHGGIERLPYFLGLLKGDSISIGCLDLSGLEIIDDETESTCSTKLDSMAILGSKFYTKHLDKLILANSDEYHKFVDIYLFEEDEKLKRLIEFKKEV